MYQTDIYRLISFLFYMSTVQTVDMLYRLRERFIFANDSFESNPKNYVCRNAYIIGGS